MCFFKAIPDPQGDFSVPARPVRRDNTNRPRSSRPPSSVTYHPSARPSYEYRSPKDSSRSGFTLPPPPERLSGNSIPPPPLISPRSPPLIESRGPPPPLPPTERPGGGQPSYSPRLPPTLSPVSPPPPAPEPPPVTGVHFRANSHSSDSVPRYRRSERLSESNLAVSPSTPLSSRSGSTPSRGSRRSNPSTGGHSSREGSNPPRRSSRRLNEAPRRSQDKHAFQEAGGRKPRTSHHELYP